MTTDWEALTDKAIAYRESKGFVAATWETLPVRIACLFAEVEELNEALAGYPAKLELVGLEIADCAMYAVTILHDLKVQSWDLRKSAHERVPIHAAPEVLTSMLRKYSKNAFEAWRRDSKSDVLISIEIFLAQLVDLRTASLGGENERVCPA